MSNTQSGALSYDAQYGSSYEPQQPYGAGGYEESGLPYGGGVAYEVVPPAPSYDTSQPSYETPQVPYESYSYGSYDPGPSVTHGFDATAVAAHPDSAAFPGQPPGPVPDRHRGPDPDLLLDPAGAPLPGPRRAARRRSKGGSNGPGPAAPPHDRPDRPDRPDTFRKLVPQALVVAFLAGGTSAFVANDKSIELSVDGAPRTLHTFADDVTELLEKEGVHVGEHDLVAPGRGQALASGDEVVVRYGRPVVLTLDGQRRQVWTTAQTVDGALRQFGVRAEGAYLSASRSSAISRRGLSLDVRTERTLTVMADGREHTIRTNAATVEEAVEEAGISLGNQDTTSVPLDSFPRDGQTVTVMRITGSREVREEVIDFRTIRRDDPSLFKGTEEVVRDGVPGSRKITYVLRTVNGVKEKPRRLSSEIARQPVDRIVKVGTKPMPTAVAGADDLNWEGLAQCESGGRPGATDPSGTYGGLYQFDRQTWQSLGGTGAAHEAPASEQTFRAKKLYVQRGASPWPHCGRRL